MPETEGDPIDDLTEAELDDLLAYVFQREEHKRFVWASVWIAALIGGGPIDHVQDGALHYLRGLSAADSIAPPRLLATSIGFVEARPRTYTRELAEQMRETMSGRGGPGDKPR